jgi:nicotinamidase-related amidase
MAAVVHRTLEEIVSPAHAALLVVDVQKDLCPPSYAPMLPRLRRVIEAARKANVYVVYVQNVVLPGGLSHSPSEISRRTALGMRLEYTLEGSPGADFMEEIAPQPGDPVVRKHRLNSFEGTSLDLLLRNRGIQSIVCTGVATHGCVISTSYAAVALSYYVVPVSDCVASWQQDLHEASLLLMRHTMHRVVDSAELIRVWRRPE